MLPVLEHAPQSRRFCSGAGSAPNPVAMRFRWVDEEVARSRDLARRCRTMAKFAVDEDLRQTLLGMAADYDRLAAEAPADEPAGETAGDR